MLRTAILALCCAATAGAVPLLRPHRQQWNRTAAAAAGANFSATAAAAGVADEDWQVVSYGFRVDPSKPGFIVKTTQLFQINESDVSVDNESLADGQTVYSTADDTRAHQLAGDAHLSGGIGPFSAAASMAVTKDADSSVKTARLDVTRNFNKARVTSKGAFLTMPHTKLDPSYTDYIHATDVADMEQISFDLGIFFARASNLGSLRETPFFEPCLGDRFTKTGSGQT
jgi:hypothetical protein